MVFAALCCGALGVGTCCNISGGASAARGAVLADMINDVLVLATRNPTAGATVIVVDGPHRHGGESIRPTRALRTYPRLIAVSRRIGGTVANVLCSPATYISRHVTLLPNGLAAHEFL